MGGVHAALGDSCPHPSEHSPSQTGAVLGFKVLVLLWMGHSKRA